MRPVRRAASPKAVPFANYRDALPDLVARLGPYCSYCERRVPTGLAVEHIQPKGLAQYAALEGSWTNFLLACVNCNTCKTDKDVELFDLLLPDRDNTFAALLYEADGSIKPAAGLGAPVAQMTQKLLGLVGFDKPPSAFTDENGKLVALDRISQRMESWSMAQTAKADIDAQPANAALRRMAARLAKSSGFFSIWMRVFYTDQDMRERLINAFPGTAGSGCFHPITFTSISPAPNPDALAHGGKA